MHPPNRIQEGIHFMAMPTTDDYCGECGLVGGGDALGCTAECASPKGKRLAREQNLIDLTRLRIARPERFRDNFRDVQNAAIRVQTIDAIDADGQDVGRLYAVVTRDGEIVSQNGTLPHGYNSDAMERPFGVVSWRSGTVSCVALDDIEIAE